MSAFSRILVDMDLNKASFDAKLRNSERQLSRFQGQLSRIGLGRLGPFALLAGSVKLLNDGMREFRDNDAFDAQSRRAASFVARVDDATNRAKEAYKSAARAAVSAAAEVSDFAGDMGAGVIGIFTGRGFVGGAREQKRRREEGAEALAEEARLLAEMAQIEERRQQRNKERARIEEQITRTVERQRDFAFSQLENSEQLRRLLEEETRLRIELEEKIQGSAETEETRLQLAETELAIAQARVRVEADQMREAQERERDRQRMLDAERKAMEEMESLREEVAMKIRNEQFRQLADREKVEDLDRRILQLRESQTDDTTETLRLESEILDLERERETIEQQRLRTLEETNRNYERSKQTVADIRAEIERIESGITTFTIEEAAAGQRGTRRGQRDARRVLALEEQNVRDTDRLNRAIERGDEAREQTLRDRIQSRQDQALGLRRGIEGLASGERDPVAQLRKQVEIMEEQLEELRALREEI